MKELFKSKYMIGFLVFLLGFFYVNAMDVQKMDEGGSKETPAYVVMNG